MRDLYVSHNAFLARELEWYCGELSNRLHYVIPELCQLINLLKVTDNIWWHRQDDVVKLQLCPGGLSCSQLWPSTRCCHTWKERIDVSSCPQTPKIPVPSLQPQTHQIYNMVQALPARLPSLHLSLWFGMGLTGRWDHPTSGTPPSFPKWQELLDEPMVPSSAHRVWDSLFDSLSGSKETKFICGICRDSWTALLWHKEVSHVQYLPSLVDNCCWEGQDCLHTRWEVETCTDPLNPSWNEQHQHQRSQSTM